MFRSVLAQCAVLLLVGCTTSTTTATPTATPSLVQVSPTAGLAVTVSVNCGPLAADLSDCLAVVAAAAKVLSVTAGSRAEVTTTTAVAMATVTFTAPNGAAQSADVITNPAGQYVGVNPRISR
jgi:hypothetical protein